MPSRVVRVVMALCTVVAMRHGGVAIVPMTGSTRVRRSRMPSRAEREQTVEGESDERQHRDQPGEPGDGVGQRMPSGERFGLHHPFSRLMSSRFTDCR